MAPEPDLIDPAADLSPKRRHEPVRIGVIGLGPMGQIHACNLATRVTGAALCAVADISGHRSRDVGRALAVRSYASHEALLQDPEIEAVVIATPPALHVEMLRDAFDASKHAFCEKPLALGGSGVDELIGRAEAKDLRFQVGHQMRYDPDFRSVADVVHAGETGRIYLVRASLRDAHLRSPEVLARAGGYFWDGAIHVLDLAQWLAGSVSEVHCFADAVVDASVSEIGDVDTIAISLRFATGALGLVDLCRQAGYGFDSTLEVVGEHATVRVRHEHADSVSRLTPRGELRTLVQDFADRFAASYVVELESFAESIRQGGLTGCSGRDGLAAVTLVEACRRSFEARAPVRLEDVRW